MRLSGSTYRGTVRPLARLRVAGLVAAPVALVLMAPALAAGTPVQQTWHADQARVPDAREAGRSGEGVVVAVLDSWVDRGHADFEGRVLPGADCTNGTCAAGPAPADQCDHGTHVAGTVASSSFGVAPRATVLPVKVLAYDPESGECVGRPDDVTAGIRWAVANGAEVVNLSLGPDVPGLSASSSIPAAVREAARAGVLVVFSAGNASVPVTDSYGGDALIVAATDPEGRLAGYSQRGSGVDLAAPGGDPRNGDVCTREDCVTSLFPGGRYSVAAGTSMAAPHVSGIAALLLGQDRSRTREQVVDRLLSTARALPDAGRGLVDARAALGVTASPPTQANSDPAPAPVAAPPAAPAAPPPAAPLPVAPAPASSAPATPVESAVALPSLPATTAPSPSAPDVAGPVLGPPLVADDDVPGLLVGLAAGLLVATGAGTSTVALRRRTA